MTLIAASCQGFSVASASESVVTIAGSGRAGIEDGPARSASFLLPFGLAYDRAGNLVVSDSAAQRIRLVRKDGRVVTLAGGGAPIVTGTWVPGAYADGDGAHARFNTPTGLTIAADGSIFVADTKNNCIRRIDGDGIVTTWVGAPERTTSTAGSRATAGLASPTALAIDRQGTLYAITQGGVARIDAAGSVTYITLGPSYHPFQTLVGLAVGDGPRGSTLFLSDVTGIYARENDGTVKYFANYYWQVYCRDVDRARPNALDEPACRQPSAATVGLKDVGAPFGLTALSDHVVAFTELRHGLVRTLDFKTGTVRDVTASQYVDAAVAGHADVDGPAERTTLGEPSGITLGPDRELVFADSGGRRIRAVAGFDDHQALTGDDFASARPRAGELSIAYAGDASIWPGETWERTVEGRLEGELQNRIPSSRAHVFPLVLGEEKSDVLSRLDSALRPDSPRLGAVVLHISADNVASFARVPVSSLTQRRGWEPAFIEKLKQVQQKLRTVGTKLYVLVCPTPEEVSPTEALWQRRLTLPGDDEHGVTPAILRAVRTAGVSAVSPGAAFSSVAAEGRGPIFAARRSELASVGRGIVADVAAAAVAERK